MKKMYATFFRYGNKIQMENIHLYVQDTVNPLLWNSWGTGFKNRYFNSFEEFVEFLEDYNIVETCFSYGNISMKS